MGAILVGGRSTRFGSPKALATLGARSIIESVLSAHRAVLPRTILVSAGDGHIHLATESSDSDPARGADRPPHREMWLSALVGTAGDSLPVVTDIIPGAGPLGGLHAALVWARERGAAGVCVTACDTPFVEASLFRTLISSCGDHDAVVPVMGASERLQPLFAWYSCRIVARIEEVIGRGRFALHELITSLERVSFLPIFDVPLRRPAELVFMNVNTPADLEAARLALAEYPDES